MLEELIFESAPPRISYLNNDMGKLLEIVARPRGGWIRKKQSTFIFGDNGKDDLKQKVIPRIIRDLSGRARDLSLVVLHDSDGVAFQPLVRSIMTPLSHLQSECLRRGISFGVFEIQRPDPSYTIHVTIVIIPMSLEAVVASAGEERYGIRLDGNSPHGRLRHLMEELDERCEPELMVRAVQEGWLEDEDWYRTLNAIVAARAGSR